MDEAISKESTSGWTIILGVISATLVWTIVYFISVVSYPQKRPLWHSLVVCLIHGIVNTILSYIIQMRKDPWPLNNPGAISTDEQILCMAVFLSFFLFEFGWYITHPGTKSLTLWIHHTVTILLVANPLYAGDSGAETCHMVFIAEVTIPPLMIRWFLSDAGSPTQYILIAEYIFLSSYFYLRVIVGTQFLFDVIMNDKSRMSYKINCWMIYIVGLVYFKEQTIGAVRRTKRFMRTWQDKSLL